MKSLLMSLLPALFIAAPAHAFIDHDQQAAVINIINHNVVAGVEAQSMRCSIRNKFCLVRFEVPSENRKISCMVASLTDSDDVLQNAGGKAVLADYFKGSLDHCLKQNL